jgi:pantoate--beta-alanine ligase
VDVITTPAAMRAWSDAQRIAGRRIGFVPTMGALHAGHLALVDEARRHADAVVVSIFVNPLQFNVAADFERYPRPIDADLEQCAAVGVDAVYAPTAAAMYPRGFDTHVEPGVLAEPFEGAHRPGHFRGVTTVVAKLFTAVQPHVAVFGRKDAQQLAIIERMTTDLDLGISIVGLPTVREADGLAMSSRNTRLQPADRAAAVCIAAGLRAAAQAVERGERDPRAVVAVARQAIDVEPRARLEYLDLVDPATFASLDAPLGPGEWLLVTAVWFGEVRLIDNLAVVVG